MKLYIAVLLSRQYSLSMDAIEHYVCNVDYSRDSLVASSSDIGSVMVIATQSYFDDSLQ
jgi:hypothetical protein